MTAPIDDPPVYITLNSDAARPLLLLCDHASRAIPKSLKNLGLDTSYLENHIAYDIGAAELAKRLSDSLGATAILAGYSRLLIDCNRQPGGPGSVVRESDGIEIPGNRDLSEAEEQRRADTYFWPSHRAITDAVAHLFRIGKPPAIVSIHSFTPVYNGEARKWDVGILWHRDPRLAMPLIEKLRGKGFAVGDNEPYSGLELAYTIDSHGGAAGLPNVVIEVRQDHLQKEHGVREWADVLHDALEDVLSIEGLHEVRRY